MMGNTDDWRSHGVAILSDGSDQRNHIIPEYCKIPEYLDSHSHIIAVTDSKDGKINMRIGFQKDMSCIISA